MKSKYKGQKFFNVWYIPHDKMWSAPNPTLYKKWMGVWAPNQKAATKLAEEDGFVQWIEEEKLAISK
jgi:hypothetical protein|tara:strand:+ start:201 stop:401 length:201 start_codon:yes stop_codon:yes gene_type:complete